MSETKLKEGHSFPVTVWIAGDINDIRHHVRNWCHNNSICITVTPTEFFYVGGSEQGARIGLANYPRFYNENFAVDLTQKAVDIAEYLIDVCCQTSALI